MIPFVVRRWSWSEETYAIITKIVVKKYPYGDVYGDLYVQGQYVKPSDSYGIYKQDGKIPNSGCYQWTEVKGVLDRG